MARKKTRKWIAGPWRDWCIPFKCNMWVQFGTALLILFLLSIPALAITRIPGILFFTFYAPLLSIVILGMTEFGSGTVRSYRRVRQVVLKNGRFNKRMQEKYAKRLYCFRAGARAAAIEYGLSDELIPALANKWRPL